MSLAPGAPCTYGLQHLPVLVACKLSFSHAMSPALLWLAPAVANGRSSQHGAASLLVRCDLCFCIHKRRRTLFSAGEVSRCKESTLCHLVLCMVGPGSHRVGGKAVRKRRIGIPDGAVHRALLLGGDLPATPTPRCSGDAARRPACGENRACSAVDPSACVVGRQPVCASTGGQSASLCMHPVPQLCVQLRSPYRAQNQECAGAKQGHAAPASCFTTTWVTARLEFMGASRWAACPPPRPA
jgi:hypothetical protein